MDNKINDKKKILMITTLAIIFTIIGSTFAYWSWTTNTEEQTTVTFTANSEYICTADGEGDITSDDKMIMPTTCTDPDRAIQRTLTTSTTTAISTQDVFMNLWLDVVDIGEGLTNSENFKYALTTQANDCTNNIITEGTFNGITTNGKITLLNQKNYIGSTNNTYYLYIWLDAAEESTDTMDQPFHFELNGECSDVMTVGRDGQFEFIMLSEDTIQISRYLGTETNVVIPSEYEGYQVKAIGNKNAEDAVGKRYNIFGETTTSNTTIKSITISEGIEYIHTGAFLGCSGLTGNLSLPSTLKEIGSFAFSKCTGLTGDLKIPEGVTKMGDAVFQQCSGFNGTLTLPDSLEEIGTSIFNHCNKFTNKTLHIPKSLRVIGREYGSSTHTFYNFAANTFAEFTIDDDHQYYKVVDGVLFSKDGTRLVSYPQNLVFYDDEGNPTRTYEMPEGVLTLDEMAFNRAGNGTYSSTGSTGLQKLILPNSLVLTTTMPDCFLNYGNNLATALYLYTGVNEIAVKDDNPNYTTIDGILYSKDEKEIWYVPLLKEGEIAIQEGTTTIKDGSVFTGGKITKLIIPASVTVIEGDMIERLNYYLKNKITIDANNPMYEITNGLITLK